MTKRKVYPRVLVADPAWKYKDKLPGKGRGADKHYPTLSIDQIARFPIPDMGDNAILFLWRVAQMQEEALFVMRAWGFQQFGELVWQKETTHGKRHFGMGRVFRNEHESCLIAMRGRAYPVRHDARSIFVTWKMPTTEEGRIRHSAKPDEFYDLVRYLYPRSEKHELFARKIRPGWQQQGNQLGKVA